MESRDLSVIIPNYNKKGYLKQCIESVLSQSVQPKEIIVVDDCSTDGSDILLQELAKNNAIIHPIFLKKNGGVSNARNVGILNAKGSYVTFMDSDDYYYNNRKLENEMALVYSSENPERCISYSRVVLVDQDGRYIDNYYNKKWKTGEFPSGVIPLKMLGLLFQRRVPRDYCVSKAFIEEVGAYCYPENYYEDLDLVTRFAMNSGCFCCTYKEGTAYRQTDNGLSKRPKVRHHDPIREIVDNYVSKCSDKEKWIIHIYRMMAAIKKKKNWICDIVYRFRKKIKGILKMKNTIAPD